MKLVRFVLLAMVALMFGSAAAQPAATPVAPQSELPFASGLNTPATFYSADGVKLGTMEVVGIERGWADYEWQEPDAGKQWVVVTMSVTNTSNSSITVDNYVIDLYDAFGRKIDAETPATNSDDIILLQSEALEPQATREYQVAFQVYSNVAIGQLVWQPVTDVIVQISLLEP